MVQELASEGRGDASGESVIIDWMSELEQAQFVDNVELELPEEGEVLLEFEGEVIPTSTVDTIVSDTEYTNTLVSMFARGGRVICSIALDDDLLSREEMEFLAAHQTPLTSPSETSTSTTLIQSD